MADAAKGVPGPFTPSDVVSWFATHYPLVKDATVRAHIIGLTANDRNRKHFKTLAGKEPLFYRLPNGTLEPFDPDRHLDTEAVLDGEDVDDEVLEGLDEDRIAFFLEVYLEDFLLTNWTRIDWGRRLSIWQGADGANGHQLATPVGRLDFLCVDDDTTALVVVELKRGLPSDRVVGQAARYMGWVRANLAKPGQDVEGLIVAHDTDDRLRFAVSVIPGLKLMVYEVSFALHQIASPS